MSINKVILVGRVGKDPEIRGFENGRSVAKFSLATDDRYKNKSGELVKRTEWHNVELWTPLAEIVEKYVRKGSLLYIEGRIQTRSYENKEGETRYITEINGREMKMLNTRAESEAMGRQDSHGAVAPSAESAPAAPSGETPDPEQVDDLPF